MAEGSPSVSCPACRAGDLLALSWGPDRYVVACEAPRCKRHFTLYPVAVEESNLPDPIHEPPHYPSAAKTYWDGMGWACEKCGTSIRIEPGPLTHSVVIGPLGVPAIAKPCDRCDHPYAQPLGYAARIPTTTGVPA